MIRLFVEAPLTRRAVVTPASDQARYLTSVMRRNVGDAVQVFNGRDGEWRALLTQAGRRHVGLAVVEQTRAQAAGPDLELVVAVVKRGPLETIVEKATELGARRVRLCVTRRTQGDRVRLDRLRAIAVEAAEQTGRLDVPEICEPERLEAVLDGWETGRRLMFCDEAGDDPDAEWGGSKGRARPALVELLAAQGREPPAVGSKARGADALGGAPAAIQAMTPAETDRTRATASLTPSAATTARLRQGAGGAPAGEAEPYAQASPLSALDRRLTGAWAVLIGPEGGFAPEERARLRGLPFTVPVSLGPRILRADTAAIAALTLWQAALGDWR